MKPQELRVGNIVEINHFEYGDMFASIISLNDVGDLCLHLLDERLRKEEYECTINEIVPIPITEELLLKNGFEQCDYIFKTLFIEMYETANGWHLHIDNERFETAIALPIKYLHQLQNAYYLITGKELEIKL